MAGTGVAHPLCSELFCGNHRYIGLKLEALRAYHTEMRPWPHARSFEAVEHLARWRGASAGVHAAEAFVLGREVKRTNRQKVETIHDNE